ncbi:hypothetical protein HZB07_05500 [Candidatus Saganbacteria bacterium]|nr:hypothetical protein [Candidatus Saganbacteria bacterium]
MRNKGLSRIKKILSLAQKLPYFSLSDLSAVEKDKVYLKISLSRYKKNGQLIKLKKGLYVAGAYLDELQKRGRFAAYPEFISTILYSPSYLSLDYILHQHNMLTEIPQNFTSMTKNKTAAFHNSLGNYFYHKIKDEFFCGFQLIKIDNFVIAKATKAKALFDYLYLRRRLPITKDSIRDLRLNMVNFNRADRQEFTRYLKLKGAQKVVKIFALLDKKRHG